MDYVTIYEDKHFGGTGILLDVGKYRLETARDLNDVVSSIEVPAGLVAVVFEHADSGGGYGISADFLENCADLAPLGLNDKISYVNVFPAQRPPNYVWRRGAVVDGRYIAGHWERRRVVEPPPNPVVTVSPPYPPHTGGIAVHAVGPHAQQARSLYSLFLRGPDDPNREHGSGRFDSSLTCAFPTLPVGRYRVRADTKADVAMTVTPSTAEVVCEVSQTAHVVIRFS